MYSNKNKYIFIKNNEAKKNCCIEYILIAFINEKFVFEKMKELNTNTYI